MPHRVWRPNIGGIRHTVVVRWNPWTFEGELIVDGPITKTWGTRMAGPDIALEIEGHPAFLRNNLTAFDLYVDGEKVPQLSTGS
jgi:hypothetical protein